MSILSGSFFQPAKGGHAPGDLRAAFIEAVDEYENWNDGEPEPTVLVRDNPLPISDVCGLLWNCSDFLPSSTVSQIKNLESFCENALATRSYAAAARWLKPRIVQARVRDAADMIA